jgi:peptidoglycan/LPS O-acetylase OafA/YrhL
MAPLSHRENNFDAVRLIAATAVIYGHAHPLTGTLDVGFLGNAVEGWAVKVFFVVSGYLITASWLADPDPRRYFEKRCLRIFPALWVVVILSMFVLGPLFTDLPLRAYFRSPLLREYSWNFILRPAYALPGVFDRIPYPHAVNGSLWSLPVEFAMYLLMPVVIALGARSRMRWLLGAVTVVLGVASLYILRGGGPRPPGTLWGTSLASSLDVCPYFLLGACAQFYQFKTLLHPGVALGMIGLAAFIQPSGAMLTELTLYILTTVAVLGFALTPAPVLSRAGRWGDFSYGIYLYGFPVQQSVNALAGSHLTPLQNAMMSIPIAVVLAVFSWRLVERRALALKPKRAAPRTVPAVEVQA